MHLVIHQPDIFQNGMEREGKDGAFDSRRVARESGFGVVSFLQRKCGERKVEAENIPSSTGKSGPIPSDCLFRDSFELLTI
jgi:hypothetical protein